MGHTKFILHTPCCRVLFEKLTGSQLVKKFPEFYGNQTCHYRLYNFSPPVPILSQLNPVHTPPTSHFLKIHLNIILPSTFGSPKWSLYLRCPATKTLYTPLLSSVRATYPAHLIFLDLITRNNI